MFGIVVWLVGGVLLMTSVFVKILVTNLNSSLVNFPSCHILLDQLHRCVIDEIDEDQSSKP